MYVGKAIGGKDDWPGDIDDVRIYNRALGLSEVKQLYNLGAANAAHANTVAVSTGLVGYWPLDGSVTNWATGQTRDISGNAYTGQLINMSTSTSPVLGKIGQALNYNGSSSYTGILNNFGLNISAPKETFSVWFKTTSTAGGVLINQTDGQPTATPGNFVPILLVKTDGKLHGELWIGGGTIASSGTVNDGKWHQAVLVCNGTTQNLYLDGGLVGSMSGTIDQTWWTSTTIGTGYDAVANNRTGAGVNGWVYFNGAIDDVRVYNRAFGPADVQQLYHQGASTIGHSNVGISNGLIGYWPLDGNTTSWTTDATQDISGNGNTGTLVGMSTTTSPTQGKIGQALQFNGSNYVEAPSSPSLEIGGQQVSAFAWIKPSSLQPSAAPTIVSKNNTVDDYQLGLSAGGVLNVRPCLISTCPSSSNTIPFNAWSFVGFTYDGSNIRIYINGALDSTTAFTSTLPTNSSDTFDIGIGSNKQYPYAGGIDEVRIYNRALNDAEVKQLYNMGR
jgi:hypothetical protein